MKYHFLMPMLAAFSILVFDIANTLAATQISNDRVFAYAEAKYSDYFPGPALNQQIQQYNYRYYPASGNYLAVDTSGNIFMLGPNLTNNVITLVGPVKNFESAIIAWEATPTWKGFPPYIGWEVAVNPAIYTYNMQLCYVGSGHCDALGGQILMDINPNDTITVSGFANGISFDDTTRDELNKIMSDGTAELNTIIFNLWKAPVTPSSSVIIQVLNTALASATSPEDLIDRVVSGFISKGFSTAGDSATSGNSGTTNQVGNTGGMAVGGYQCPTTKVVNDPDWVQSHGSYWAAASAHNAYTTCLKTDSEATCHNYYTLETQYCNYAKPACLTVVTSASNCPG